MRTQLFASGKQNVFTSFLQALNVKHTKEFTSKYYNEHPYKYSLFGLSKMLSEYNVENLAMKSKPESKDIRSLEPPFIAYAAEEFVLVSAISDEKVDYLWRKSNLQTPIEEFNKIWNGVVLFAETNENSIEPNYKENRKKERFNIMQKTSLIFATILLAGILCVGNNLYESLESSLLLLANFVGVYVGYLLILKQLHIHSDYADKICSLFQKSDCNNILESPAAKFLNLVGWSEIGFAYFISNVLIILSQPHLTPYLTLINICALPYTIWSIWYQKFKAKQWCPLCIVVQVLLWCIFIINLFAGNIYIPEFTGQEVLTVMCIYALPLLAVSLLLPNLSKVARVEALTQAMQSFKLSDDVFQALLYKQKHVEADRYSSKVLFGNPEARTMVTILTNPHCEPCARMHKRVEKLLNETGDKLCIQYIFSSFSEDLIPSNKFLIAAYLNNNIDGRNKIIGEWFNGGKYDKEIYFKKYGFDINAEEVEKEHALHIAWKEQANIRATPTVFVNGYELPDVYTIEDLKYFTNLEVNSK